ncbi:hypothetical protein GJ496_006314 [Pomphorhynchus laevis]|nr:hypothetical protein GJ496_006314 [Pomphorhynchus laevis]
MELRFVTEIVQVQQLYNNLGMRKKLFKGVYPQVLEVIIWTHCRYVFIPYGEAILSMCLIELFEFLTYGNAFLGVEI